MFCATMRLSRALPMRLSFAPRCDFDAFDVRDARFDVAIAAARSVFARQCSPLMSQRYFMLSMQRDATAARRQTFLRDMMRRACAPPRDATQMSVRAFASRHFEYSRYAPSSDDTFIR